MTGSHDVPKTISPRRTRRATWAVRAGVVVIVAALVASAALLRAASHARADVEIQPRLLTCDGHRVPFTIVNGSDEQTTSDPFAAFDVALSKGSVCQLELTVLNRGDHTVHVGTATFPDLGVADVSPFPLELTASGEKAGVGKVDGSAAVLDVATDLAPMDSVDIVVDLRTRRSFDGTNKDRMAFVTRLPTIGISYLGVPGSIRGSVGLAVRG